MRSPWLITLATALFSSLFLLPASGVEVIGDDDGDRFRGSDGLLLPATVPYETRIEVSRCPDCDWRVTGPCVASPDEGAHTACQAMLTGCPSGQVRLRAWFSDDGGATWRDLGLLCIGPGGPVTVKDVEDALRDEFERLLPPLLPSTQPSQGILPHLPVLFDSGQSASMPISEHTVLGHRVVLRPQVSWSWSFGDGGQLTTAIPASRYPDNAVSHIYRVGGPMRVQVTAHWTARFDLDDLGTFPVHTPVLQRAGIVAHVGQARAVLVPGGPSG